MKKGISTDKL